MKAQAAWGKGNVGDFLDLTRDSEDGFEEGSSSLEFGSDSESNSDFKFLSELLSESKPESKTKSDSEGLKLKGGAGFFLGAPPCTGDVLRSSPCSVTPVSTLTSTPAATEMEAIYVASSGSEDEITEPACKSGGGRGGGGGGGR